MKSTTLVLKSLRFYWRTHLGVFFGTVLSTAILVGALIVGDSVRFSLQQLVFKRLGNTQYAMSTGDRFFRTELADSMSADLGTPVAAVLQLQGIAIKDGGAVRVNQIAVHGIDEKFWQFGDLKSPLEISDQEIVVNQRLADKLDLQPGDEFLLKVEKAEVLPAEAPFSLGEKAAVSFWLKIKQILGDSELGRFSLQANQVSPYSVFLPRTVLVKKMELANRANVILTAFSPANPISLGLVQASLRRNWKLADAGLILHPAKITQSFELTSERIFLEPDVVTAAQKITPEPVGIFTYFVNEIRAGKQWTPYSFVSAPGAPIVPPSLNDDEIIINQWLAQDLNLRPGDFLDLVYFVLLPTHQLEEQEARFKVKQVVPMQLPFTNTALMPAFPGLAGAESCREWEPGIPIDLDLIRDKDEQYWEMYHGAPKAFITLKKARQLWGNRFGNLTALNFTGTNPQEITNTILQNLDPVSLGFQFRPVREEGLQAGAEAVDFGQLFLGLSFFIILAALLLIVLLFVLGIEQRSGETGSLLALGFPVHLVNCLLLWEGGIIALLGGLCGIVVGVGYNEFVLYALSTVWKGATGNSVWQLHLRGTTLLVGFLASVFMSIVAMWLTVRKQTRRAVVQLQQPEIPFQFYISPKWFKIILALILLCVLLVGAVLFKISPKSGQQVAGIFFGLGAVLLLISFALTYLIIGRLNQNQSTKRPTFWELSVRNSRRRAGRSLAVIALLACGIFLVFSVGANRFDPTIGTEKRTSGTGGFAFWGETVLPILYNLNDELVQEQLGIDAKDSLRFVPFRVFAGEDASCLNLNRIQRPQILGVPTEELARRNAFSLAAVDEGLKIENSWRVLNQSLAGNVIPAIADQTVITWGLGKSVGDTLNYRNERGQEIKFKLVAGLANSVFQGNVIISQENFLVNFPSTSGYRIFLIDCPPGKRESASTMLSQRLQDFGLDLSSTAVRLAEFNVVTETYLRIFLALGGFGLLIGSIGLGIVVFRNTQERRGELALLRAVGYNVKTVHRVLLTEHLLLLATGILCGVLSAFFSILPAIFTSGNVVPYFSLGLLLVLLVVWGILWIWLSTKFAMKGELLAALRNE